MVKAKICGLKTKDAIKCALDNGADYLGFVFFDKSPRNISFMQAFEFADFARGLNSEIPLVAVMVSPNDAEIAKIKACFNPDYFQIHNISKRRAEELMAHGHNLIAAHGIENSLDFARAKECFDLPLINLFDAKPPKDSENAGGHGVSFDWALLNEMPKTPWFLSGGLNEANVAAAIRINEAPMVDVSSGVESSPGIKDLRKIESFLKAAKAV